MTLRISRKHWLTLLIVLCIALLILLGVLQLVWTGQLSGAQMAMMQNVLDNAAGQFERELGRQLMLLTTLVRPEEWGGPDLDWRRCAEGYALWAETSAHAGLLARILVQQVDTEGEVRLMEIPLGATEPVAVTWPPQLAAVERRLAQVRAGAERMRGSWPLAWRLLPEARVLLRPIASLNLRARRILQLPRRRQLSFLILVLDWKYVAEQMLPELVDRLFSVSDGQRLYDVAIAVRAGRAFLYRSDASIDSEWLASADVRRPLRAFWSQRERPEAVPPAPVDGLDSILRSRLEAVGNRGVSALNDAGQRVDLRSPLSRRDRIVVVGAENDLNLEFAAAHVSGSLAGAVAWQRVRNLGLGLGVLLLLAGAMVLVVLSARRASRLAAMQMEFIAGVTHELRTPLAVVCSVGENLADGVVTSAAGAKRYGELILTQGRRLHEMVEATLQLASLEAGKRHFRLDRIHPGQLVDRAVDEARPMIEQAGFELEHTSTPDLPWVRTDESTVLQILANLISNAVKYGEPGRWIRIEADASERAGDPEVRIRVRDRGMGISRKDAARIFSAYYRGAAANAGGIPGSGLGLKLAHDLARGVGAKLSVRSEPGQGSVFTLHLPVMPQGESV